MAINCILSQATRLINCVPIQQTTQMESMDTNGQHGHRGTKMDKWTEVEKGCEMGKNKEGEGKR